MKDDDIYIGQRIIFGRSTWTVFSKERKYAIIKSNKGTLKKVALQRLRKI